MCSDGNSMNILVLCWLNVGRGCGHLAVVYCSNQDFERMKKDNDCRHISLITTQRAPKCGTCRGDGYFPNPAKTTQLVKPEHKIFAEEVFDGSGIQICDTGVRYLGVQLAPTSLLPSAYNLPLRNDKGMSVSVLSSQPPCHMPPMQSQSVVSSTSRHMHSASSTATTRKTNSTVWTSPSMRSCFLDSAKPTSVVVIPFGCSFPSQPVVVAWRYPAHQ